MVIEAKTTKERLAIIETKLSVIQKIGVALILLIGGQNAVNLLPVVSALIA